LFVGKLRERLLDQVDEPRLALQCGEQGNGLTPLWRGFWSRFVVCCFLFGFFTRGDFWQRLTIQGGANSLGDFGAEQSLKECAKCQANTSHVLIS
jgi:hypothetical protein